MRRLLVLLALVLLAGCGTDVSTGDKGYVSGGGGITTFKAGDRKQAPAISGTTLEGKKVTVKGLAAGRPTVINMWGSWCGECRKETPLLNAAAKKLGDRASFLGVDVRDSNANALAFQRSFDVPYPSLFDPDGRALLGMPRGTTVYAVPSTIVLDGRGRIAATVAGEIPSALTLVELVKSAA